MTQTVFLLKRGNSESEAQQIFQGSDQVEAMLQGITPYTLCKTFERLMKRTKKTREKKKRGRPKKIRNNPLNF